MSQENVEFGCRRLGRWNRRRVSVSVAALVGLACALLAAAPGGAGATAPFRQLPVISDSVWSDGVRFAFIPSPPEPPYVVDTLLARRFQLIPPRLGCDYSGDGGGLALWQCHAPPQTLISEIVSGASREPAGIAQLAQMETELTYCRARDIGRHWLAAGCEARGIGPASEPPLYLNHRTGLLRSHPRPLGSGFTDDPRIDLNYARLVRPACRPLKRPLDRGRLTAYQPPFALRASPTLGFDPPEYDQLRLRRCGRTRAEIVSRCHPEACVAAQLGSRYVTWAQGERVFAYLPRIRRRVLVGRAPAGADGQPLFLVHTCTRVLAYWAPYIYVARFEPRRGAPRCQTRSRARGSTAVP